jgi:hypothetical protein
MVEWSDCDNLLQAIHAVDRHAPWEIRNALKLTGPISRFGGFALPLELADQGVVGLRIEDTLWLQGFRAGWPVTPPTPGATQTEGVSLVVAASLNPSFYESFGRQSLPFTLETVQDQIPESARQRVVLEWHEHNDLFHPLNGTDHCICDPDALRCWM